jgi:tetratricopeptide (TPR) repeat protein
LISRSLGTLILLCCLDAVAQPVAPPPGDCEANPVCAQDLAAGISDYQQHRYDTALSTFQKAFTQSSDPRLLVLMGRTQYKLGDSRGALERYERARPQIKSPADLAKLEQYVAEARTPAGPVVLTSPPPPPPTREKKLKPWMWALIGVSAAAVVGAAVGVGVYYGTGTPRPDATVSFP